MDIKEKLETLPLSPGVYIMYDRFGNIIYIGKARKLKNRVSQYFLNKTHTDKVKSMVSQVADFEYILTNSELDALVLESNLIKKHQPFYNILLKDGKSYPYIKIDTNEDFPKLEVVRKVKKDGAKYFGPYFGLNAYDIVKAVNYAYPVRTCSKRIKDNNKIYRGCLNYSLGLCSAPCMCKITKEDYAKLLPYVYDFLNGKDEAVYNIICNKMDQAVNVENFELAINLRDLKFLLIKLRERTITALPNASNIDVVGIAKSENFYVFSVLIIRQGKMMGAKNFSFENAYIDDEEMLLSFLTQYYLKSNMLPEKIVLPIKVDVEDALFKKLSDSLGQKLDVFVPNEENGEFLTAEENADIKGGDDFKNYDVKLENFDHKDAKNEVDNQKNKDDIIQNTDESGKKEAFLTTNLDKGENFDNNLINSGKISENGAKKPKVVVPIRGVFKKLLVQANNNANEFLTKNCEGYKGRKKKKMDVLETLKDKLGLKNIPFRIEGYDISNISGTSSVCSMVVFINGAKASKHYRKFKIKEVVGPNDFASLKESITRRLEKLNSEDISFSSKPDLILIDGGKGQIGTCRDLIKQYNSEIDVISLAKKQEEIFVEDNLVSVKLSKDDDGLKLLQKVRDEAHRFAITFHRKLRKKKQIESVLDEIEGLGKVRRENLIAKFKTVRRIKKASIEDLISVDGINPKLASEILKYLEDKF